VILGKHLWNWPWILNESWSAPGRPFFPQTLALPLFVEEIMIAIYILCSNLVSSVKWALSSSSLCLLKVSNSQSHRYIQLPLVGTSRCTRSSASGLYSLAPIRTRSSYGDRAFSACGPHLWNGLPQNIRATTEFTIVLLYERWSVHVHCIYNLPIYRSL
jgi:hypothetical protein